MADQYPVVPFIAPQSQGMEYPDLLKAIQGISTGLSHMTPQISGSNIPMLPQSQVSATMPTQPQMVPTNQPTQVRPTDTSLYARRRADSQGWGNLLGNAIGMVANAKAQEQFQKNTKTVTDATNYLQGIKNAQLLKQMYPNDPAVAKMADAAIAQNTDGWKNLTSDEKTRKMIGKALSWDFTDPQKMASDPDVKAGQAGIAQATQQHAAGISAVTPQDKQIQDMLNQGGAAARQMGAQGQGLPAGPMAAGVPQPAGPTSPVAQRQAIQSMMPPPTATGVMGGAPSPQAMQAGQQAGAQGVRPQNRMEQYLATRPVSFVENPAFAAQQAFEQKIFESAINKLGPAWAKEQGLNIRANLKDATDRWKETNKEIAAMERVTQQGKDRLEQIHSTNSKDLLVQQSKAAMIKFGIESKTGDPRVLGVAGAVQMKGLQTSIDKVTQDMSRDEVALKNAQASADLDRAMGRDSTENDSAVEEIKQRRKLNDQYLKDLYDERKDLGSAMATLPQQQGGGAGAGGGVAIDQSLLGQATGQPQGAAPTGAAPTAARGFNYGASGALAPAIGGPKATPRQMEQWYPTIDQYAKQYNVDPNLVASIIQQESGGKPSAISRTGATGLGQFTRETGKQYGLMTDADRRNPVKNIDATAHYISDLIQQKGGNVQEALATYYGKKEHPDWPNYVKSVMAEYQRRGGGTSAGAAGTAVGSVQPTTSSLPGTGITGEALESARTGKPAAQFGGRPTAPGQGPSSTELDAINRLLQKTGGQ